MTHRGLSSLAVAVLIALPTSTAMAQEEQAAQDSTPSVPTIAYGETIADALSSSDATFADGSYFRPYLLQGTEGDTVSMFLASRDFDAALLLFTADSAETLIASDGNSGGDCNAHLSTRIPETGTYAVVVSGTDASEHGEYELTVVQGSQLAPSAEPCRAYTGVKGTVSVGDSIVGTLGEGDRMMGESLFQVWLLENPLNVPYTVDLNSDEFDAALMLVRGINEAVILDDDSGDGGCHARIPHQPDDDRPYRLVLVSRTPGKGGEFLLRVTEGLSSLIGGNTCNIVP